MPSVPAYSFPKKRPHELTEPTPGPGEYNLAELEKFKMPKSPATLFRRSRPFSEVAFRTQIGPGFYDIQEQKTGKSFTFPKSGVKEDKNALRSTERSDDVPNSEHNRSTSSSRRESRLLSTPGPGDYNPSPVKGNGKAYSIPKSNQRGRSNERAATPGPGFYNAPSNTLQTRGSTIGRAVVKGATSTTPGPGFYDAEKLRITPKSPSYMFGKAFLNTNDNKKTRLSANFRVDAKHYAARGIFPTAPDRSAEKENNTPGPGDYEQAVSFWNHGFAFNREPRTRENRQPSPGPGEYAVQSPKNERGWAFPRAQQSSSKNSNPGPGEYTMPELESRGFTFPKGHYAPSRSSAPGYYDLPPTVPDVAPYHNLYPQKKKIHL